MIIRAQNIAVVVEDISAIERQDWSEKKSIYIYTRGIAAPQLALEYDTVEERDAVHEYIISLMSGVIDIDKIMTRREVGE